MATPQYRVRDETAGLTLVSPGGETREQTRVLFTPLDILDPIRKRQGGPKLRMGGEEINSRCLRRTQFYNFLPRCAFVPLEKWFEPIGFVEQAGDRSGDLVTVAQSNPAKRPQIELESPQMFRAAEPIKGIPRYPGEEVPLIMEIAGHRGVREITALRNEDWDTGKIEAVNGAFFPLDWDKRTADGELPIQLRLIEERIHQAVAEEAVDLKLIREQGGQPTPDDTLLSRCAPDMLTACETARQWGSLYINLQHGHLRTRIAHQWTYAYSAISQQLLDQLEIAPFEEGSAAMKMLEQVLSKVVAQQPAQAQPVDIGEIVKQVMLAMNAVQANTETKEDKKK